ncbi:MAG: prepilin-type N-terminal cleavage/methylation domain-containing protein [Candidatus Pacebacteria bacterium]|nr:prepilin-type N-terminal cleavage/methylation domain-containing protein [Candidatus Paceibacterota bacterium]
MRRKTLQKNTEGKQRGFTLIETLVAISILLLSISAPLTIASRGLATAQFARDQVIAFYLAQDAVEYIRNLRDENSLSGLSWLNGLASTDGAAFTIDTIDGDMELCPVDGCPPLEYNAETGFYGYGDSGAQESYFVRSVSVEVIDTQEAVITITLSWSAGVFSRTFSITENIFDWQ